MEQEQEQQQQTWKVWEDGWKANLKLLGIDRVLQQQLLFAYCCVEMDETNAELIGSGLLLDKTNAQLHVIHLSALQTLEATPSSRNHAISEVYKCSLVPYQLPVQDDRTQNWRIQAVAVSPDDFRSRKPLPVNWRGLENDQLLEVSGIPGCVFVHASGFTGGNRSYEGALEMARASLKA